MLLIRCAGCDGLAVLGRDGRRRCHTEVLGARSTRWARPKVRLEVLVDDGDVDDVIVGRLDPATMWLLDKSQARVSPQRRWMQQPAGTGAAARRAPRHRARVCPPRLDLVI